MLTWPKASSTPSFASMRLASATWWRASERSGTGRSWFRQRGGAPLAPEQSRNSRNCQAAAHAETPCQPAAMSAESAPSRGGTGEQHMNPVVAVIAPGMMGGAVAGRLVENGVKVLTSLAGRSPATVARANKHGLTSAGEEEIAAAEFILSIVPPGEAVALAQRFAPALTASNSKPVYVDCNAVSPPTVERVAAAVAPTGCGFVDAGIIGSPPLAAVMMLAATRGGSADALFAELKESQSQMLAYMQRALSVMPPKAYR